MKKLLLLKLFALVAAMLCALGAAAAEAYACYTSSNTTLTFYYDNQRSSRPGTTYDLNSGSNDPGWYTDGTYSNVTKVVFNSSFASARPTTTYYWFGDMSKLQSITGTQYFNTSQVTNMCLMFAGAGAMMPNLNANFLNTSNVKTMESMFANSEFTSIIVSDWNTSEVTNMLEMFAFCYNLTSLDLSNFNTSKVTTMEGMFNEDYILVSLDLSNWNTSNVTNMNNMFHECNALTSVDLSSFNTAKVTTMYSMFDYCTSLTSLDLSSFNTSKVTDMRWMFSSCSKLTTIYAGSGWSTAATTDSNSDGMFRECTKIRGGQGTTYDASHTNRLYARIDGGPSNPGYFTAASEPYACYTSSNTTLTFYYDTQRSRRPGTTYDLNTGDNDTGWYTDGTYSNVTKVVFDPSFAGARPTTTCDWFYNMQNLQSITGLSYLNTSEVTNMGFMFQSCNQLTSLDVSHFNTSKVIYMNQMFSGCTGLTSLDVSSFNTSNVKSMYGMFAFCDYLTSLDLSNWNTSQVTNMSYMFYNCNNLRTVYVGNGWTTAAVENSNNMFWNCTSLVGGQGTTWNSSNPKDKTYAHIDGGPSNPGYFTEWKEAYACYTPSNTTLTFYYDNQRSSRTGTTYDLNTGNTDVAWDTDGTNASVTKVVFDPSFANARPTTTYDWFYYMQNLESITGMSYLNTSEVTNMAWMFTNCKKLTSLDVSHFNTSKVTDMTQMFYCTGLTNLDLSNFNTSKVTNMRYMFYGSSNLRTIYVGNDWSTAAVEESYDMFTNCFSLVGGQGTTYNSSNPTDKTYAHIDGGPSNPGYFTAEGEEPWNGSEAYACYTSSNTTLTFYYDDQRTSRPGTTYDLNTGANDTGWDTDGTKTSVTKVVFDPSFAGARPTTTCDWFYGMRNLQSITGMSYLNTSEVTNMNWMFMNCPSLTSLDVSHFNTSQVTDMSVMFYGCIGLTSLDLGSFNTSKVTDMSYMFFGCTNLRTIYVGGGWSTAAVTSSVSMFTNCTSLVGGQGTTYDANHIDKAYAHIDGGTSNPGYFTAKNAGLRGDVNGDGNVDITDATSLINYLLYGDATGFNMANANCDLQGGVDITDATTLINYLLYGTW